MKGNMRIQTLNVEAIEITDAPNLDTIQVFWTNFEPNRGSVTICCYGSAWTAYFGGMGSPSIQEFFAGAPTDYLVIKLGITPQLKQAKANLVYLARIVNAVKAALAVEASE